MPEEQTPIAETEVVETTEQVEVEAQPADWDNALANAFAPKEATEDVAETVVEDPAAPFPSEEVTEEPTEKTEAEAALLEAEEEPTLEEVLSAEGRPLNFNREQLRIADNQVLKPFRDPQTPITEVRERFRSFHPTRFQELEQTIVNESAQNHPDQWLQAVLGLEDVTVDSVKDALLKRDNPVSQPEQLDTEKYLNDLYGEDWKDSVNDESILPEDLNAVKAQRKVLELDALVNSGNSELQEKLDKATRELEKQSSLIEEVKKTQEAEFQRAVEASHKASTEEYRTQVEQKAIPKLFTELGLTPSENDAEDVKSVKEGVNAYFQPSYGHISEFDLFMSEGFTQREAIGNIVRRVNGLLQEAAVADAKSKQDPSQAEVAKSLQARAMDEQNALSVLTKSAAKEFLESPRVKGQMALLERISDLERRLALSGRQEIIGSTDTISGSTFKDQLKEKEDKWDADFISSQLSQSART